MKKIFLLFSVLTTLSITAFAQKPVLTNKEDSLKYGYWNRNTQIGINFTQAYFSDNWTGGGINNIALGFVFNNKADYVKGKGMWTNDMQFLYGMLKNKDAKAVKSLDRLFIESKYAHKINPKLNWFAGANFLTQFAPGYTYSSTGERQDLVSSFLAPGYLSEGIGLEYKPDKSLYFQLGGATMRQTFVNNNSVLPDKYAAHEARYGVEYGKTLLNEFGLQGVIALDKDIAKNLNLKMRYQAFWAYAPERKPTDHFINLVATAKINKYLNVNFMLIGLRDQDQTKKWQFNQGLAAGFSVKL